MNQNNTNENFISIEEVHALQQQYFSSGVTKNIQFRIDALKKFSQLIKNHELEIKNALYQDLKKSNFESHATEYSSILQEIDLFIKKIPHWSKRSCEKFNLVTFPAKPYVYQEPFGNVLIIAPWNYPLLLALMPAIGALAAGNTCVLKPSEISKHTSAIIAKLVNSHFEKKYFHVFEGDANTSEKLLNLKWDYIFFTGSPKIGGIVYQKAAKHLTPVTLELGGKSPCIINEDANLALAAKRIIWGKFTNAGQTCVAPDYLLIHKNIKEKLIIELKKSLYDFYGSDPKKSNDFGRIVSLNHWNRLLQMAKEQNPHLPMKNFDQDELYIAPMIFENCDENSPLMKDEIFGPLLPCLEFSSSKQLYEILNKNKYPLACYIFTEDNNFSETLIENFSFGGGCINDVLMHLANHNLPFGGVGTSGIGSYHGKKSFETFSHRKPILKQSSFFDFASFKYPPSNSKKYSLLKFFTR